jgi:hypothetical protein
LFESHEIGVKPPKIKPFVVNIRVTVFPFPSHFPWKFDTLKPSRVPRYSNTHSFLSNPLNGEGMVEMIVDSKTD